MVKNYESMDENKLMNVSLEFEHFLSSLYGKSNYHQFVGEKTIDEWRKVLIKLLKSIKRSISLTIEQIDNSHKERLLSICESTEQKILKMGDKDSLNEQIILSLSVLIFEILGNKPNNWDLDLTNHDNHWRLNGNRQISYYQTSDQKAATIINNALKANHQKFTDLQSVYANKFSGNAQKFCHWFKNQYPEEYLKLF